MTHGGDDSSWGNIIQFGGSESSFGSGRPIFKISSTVQVR
jgi:hypothetical protein